ncbi:MAG: hypothetical protein F4X81_01280 [Gammaproteobacteria bacterium]|nr:hypothetical protein [Gammaproteobacteria bacterium]MYE50082.1 hypothetical protein [Gammaproteobacteria bacterium]MYG11761.1 hypothetical protein [Gammaproteobacteria bacterium]MYH16432.1 hypothetical protein [Gammaproteobacteria bacterium]MYK30115.1 hypothetical protein [Gammaproteobacteria bacterium]
MKEGDIVVLKMGLSKLRAIGVVGTYEHVDEFNDVDGWELGHARRVRWLHKKPHDFKANVFTRRTTTRLYGESALTWIRNTLDPIDDGSWIDLEPVALPPEDGGDLNLERDDLAASLFERGLPSDAIRDLLDPNGSFVQMANWYWNQSASEHETVCHLVVPLLKVLGWTPQKIALEHNRIDVALFSRLPREDEDKANLAVVVEAKALHKACLGAFEQAKRYAQQYSNCNRIIVTDGLRFGVFVREGEAWPEDLKPYAYLNVRRLRSSYPIYREQESGYELLGAKQAIHAMTPGWNPDLDLDGRR